MSRCRLGSGTKATPFRFLTPDCYSTVTSTTASGRSSAEKSGPIATGFSALFLTHSRLLFVTDIVEVLQPVAVLLGAMSRSQAVPARRVSVRGTGRDRASCSFSGKRPRLARPPLRDISSRCRGFVAGPKLPFSASDLRVLRMSTAAQFPFSPSAWI
jgi:hypothetical protein